MATCKHANQGKSQMSAYGPDVSDIMAAMFDAVRGGAGAVRALAASDDGYGSPEDILSDALRYRSCIESPHGQRFMVEMTILALRELRGVSA